jgi:hypothetical protein
MSQNRRNHYRMLHVQTDAPPEVIKAAYRALMAIHHPDVGGEHAKAVMINEAYTILSNPTRRAEYDALRLIRWSRQHTAEHQAATGASAGNTTANGTRHSTGAPAGTGSRASGTPPNAPKVHLPGVCPMCQLKRVGTAIARDTRCTRCKAPLATIKPGGDPLNPAERRQVPRMTKSDWAILHSKWPSDVIDVRMRDLSIDGLSVYCGAALPVGRTIRVISDAFDVVADIVTCRQVDKVFTLHARLVTAIFATDTGGFVSTTA